MYEWPMITCGQLGEWYSAKLTPLSVLTSNLHWTRIGRTVTRLVSVALTVWLVPTAISPFAVAVTILVELTQWFVLTMQLAEPPTGNVAGKHAPKLRTCVSF